MPLDCALVCFGPSEKDRNHSPPTKTKQLDLTGVKKWPRSLGTWSRACGGEGAWGNCHRGVVFRRSHLRLYHSLLEFLQTPVSTSITVRQGSGL